MVSTPSSDLARNGSGRRQAARPLGRGQLTRLFRLVLLLQSDRLPNARELAQQCEVSRRTIYRDLEVLAEAGIPVRFRPERQGYQLAKGFFLPPVALDEKEALALLVLARQWNGGDGLGLQKHAWSGAVKLVQVLAPEIRDRVLAASDPFRIGPNPSRQLSERKAVCDAILEALARRRQLRVWYRIGDMTSEECTKLGLYRLLQRDRHWFMVGRTSLHRRVDVIGIHWVRRVVLTEDSYVIPPRFNVERFLERAWAVERSPMRYGVTLRFSPRAAAEVCGITWHRSQRTELRSDGGADVSFQVDGLDEILRWVLGFGDQVVVLRPQELRDRVFEVAEHLAQAHSPLGSTEPRPEQEFGLPATGNRAGRVVDSANAPFRMKPRRDGEGA
jgi:proteasome accessory factor B